jgi:hypothetical protein
MGKRTLGFYTLFGKKNFPPGFPHGKPQNVKGVALVSLGRLQDGMARAAIFWGEKDQDTLAWKTRSDNL